MSITYTRQEILDRINKAKGEMNLFYKHGFVNYRGRTKDTKEYCTEIVAEWCCNNISLFQGIDRITRDESYKVDTHDGIPPTEDSNREEELIAMAMFRQRKLPIVGEILDYQTPLKNKQKDKAGKIDILAYDGSTLRILELKEPDSKETMLRCVLEGFTYLSTVNIPKLLEDFKLPPETRVKACPFVFKHGAQHKEMKAGRPHIEKLMVLLNSKPYYVSEQHGVYEIMEG